MMSSLYIYSSNTLTCITVSMSSGSLATNVVTNAPAFIHECDVIMGAMVCQITCFTIVYSIVYSGAAKKKPLKLPAQMASNAENVFIWWRRNVGTTCVAFG